MVTISDTARKGLLSGHLKKYIVIQILEDDGSVYVQIPQANLVKDSFEMTSRLCSKEELKFGLCEGSNISFQVYGLTKDVKGLTCKVFVRVFLTTSKYEDIPLGYYTISSVIKKQSSGLTKITAYDKLNAGTFDVDFQTIINFDEPYLTTTEHYLYAMLKYIREKGVEIDGTEGAYTLAFNGHYVRNLKCQDGWYLNIYYYCLCYKITDYDAANYYQFNVNVHDIFEECMSVCDCHDEVLEDGTTYYETACAGTNWIASGCTSIDLAGKSGSSDPTVAQIFGSDAAGWERTDYYNEKNGENLGEFYIWLPVYVTKEYDQATSVSSEMGAIVDNIGYVVMANLGTIAKVNCIEGDNDLVYTSGDDIDVTVRELLSAYLEQRCQFAVISRESNTMQFMELNSGGLYPQLKLYPDDALYPSGAVETAFRTNYKSLYLDDAPVKKYKNLVITYLTSDGSTKATYTHMVHTYDPSYVDYVMDDNWLLLNNATTETEVAAMAEIMEDKMLGLSWKPFEMDAVNMCYLEPGDMIELQDADGKSYVSYILEQDLKGVPVFEDTFYYGEVETF